MSDGLSVICVSYCTCLVYTISDLRTFNFYHTKAIDCRSEYFVHFLAISMFVILHSLERPMERMLYECVTFDILYSTCQGCG